MVLEKEQEKIKVGVDVPNLELKENNTQQLKSHLFSPPGWVETIEGRVYNLNH